MASIAMLNYCRVQLLAQKAYWAWVPATNDTWHMQPAHFGAKSSWSDDKTKHDLKMTVTGWVVSGKLWFLPKKKEKPDGPAVTHTTVGWCVDIEIHDTGMGPDTKVWLLEQGCEVQIFSKQHLTDWFIDQHLKPKRSLHKVIPFACQPTQQAPPSHCFHDGLGPFFGDVETSQSGRRGQRTSTFSVCCKFNGDIMTI